MTKRPSLRPQLSAFILLTICTGYANPHDLPRQRVDRTVQLRFEPARLLVEYTLELDDATIARDLKRLRNLGELPPDPDEWLNQYAALVAPLIASSLSLNGPEPGDEIRAWEVLEIQRRREIHTIYAFRFGIALTKPGEYRFRDTNFATSEGISRLGVVANSGAVTQSDETYPAMAANEPYRPAWMLDEKELRKTVEWSGRVIWTSTQPETLAKPGTSPSTTPLVVSKSQWAWSLRLGILSAVLLGVVHTLQPGHGKTLLAAAAVDGNRPGLSRWSIAVGWAVSHFAVIFLLATLSLMLPEADLVSVSISLKKIAGFLIACPAAYRLGDGLRTFSIDATPPENMATPEPSFAGRLSATSGQKGLLLGLSAGLIPCWEAIGLLLLGISAGHLLTGLSLVAAFVAGSLSVVLISISAARRFFTILDPNRKFGRFLMIGLNVLVLATGANLLLARTWFQPFRS